MIQPPLHLLLSKRIQERNFCYEELECIRTIWENLRVNTADTGLFIFTQFFSLYPEEIQKYDFNKDEEGNIRPDYLTSKALRKHSVKIIEALDTGAKEALSQCVHAPL